MRACRELKDFLRTGSPDVTYTNVKRPGTGWVRGTDRCCGCRAKAKSIEGMYRVNEGKRQVMRVRSKSKERGYVQGERGKPTIDEGAE